MAKLNGLKTSKTSISQTLNLRDLLGRRPTETEKEQFIQAAIDRIEERTADGKSVNGTNLKSPYSKMYADSLDFRAAGKSRSDVNMKLSGDMLGALDGESGRDTVTLFFDDETEAAKAANHHQGITVPRRPFFGINQKEAREIASSIEGDGGSDENSLTLQALRALSGGINIDG